MTWLTDSSGNRASTEYFGSTEAAQAALDSLKECKNCTNCSHCSYCSDCSHCSHCSYCSYCSYCSHCSGCSDCSRCSRCSYCSDCSHCSQIEDKNSFQPGTGWKMPEAPIIPNIHQAVYDAATQRPGCFDMSRWHCGTTHCRAGWVVTLAGEAGKALELATSTPFAAMQIYRASDPTWRMSNFFASNEDALDDMRRLADAGKANHEPVAS